MMVNLANEFAKVRIKVDFLLARKSGPYVNIVDSRVSIHELAISFTNPLLIIKLTKYLRKEKPAAILSAMTYPNIAVLVASIFAMTKTRLIISERVTIGIQAERSSSLKERLKPKVARLIYKRADHVIAISNGVADNLTKTIGIPRSKITTIYNPVVTSSLNNKLAKPRHPFYSSKRKIVLSAGRLVPQKDYSTLIQAFQSLLKKCDVSLIILGEGPLRDDLNEQIKSLGLLEHVSLPGFDDNLFSYMQHASVFVLSSQWEGFGNVLVESMACGCPVVSTDCPSGPSEILADGRYGALVKPGNPDELARAIFNTLQNPIPPNVLRERANEFRADIIAKQYLNLLLGK